MQNPDRWHNHFLQLCLDHARMSKDPNTRVGALIVDWDRNIRAAGFNGFPRGIEDTEMRLHDRETKLRLIVHAECNAICAAARIGVKTSGCTLYLAATDSSGLVWGGPPCVRCTVHAIQAGIMQIVSRPKKSVPSRWSEDLLMAESLLNEAGIEYQEIEVS